MSFNSLKNHAELRAVEDRTVERSTSSERSEGDKSIKPITTAPILTPHSTLSTMTPTSLVRLILIGTPALTTKEKSKKKSIVDYPISNRENTVAEPRWGASGRDDASGPVGDSSPALDPTPDPAAAGPSESAAPDPTPAPRPMWASIEECLV